MDAAANGQQATDAVVVSDEQVSFDITGDSHFADCSSWGGGRCDCEEIEMLLGGDAGDLI